MRINRSLFFSILGGLILAVFLFLLWEFSPKRQVNKAFARLIAATEVGDFEKVRSLMAPDYRDQWGMDAAQAVSAGREVVQHFLLLEIEPMDPRLSVQGSQAELLVRLRLLGKGSAIAQAVMDRANEFKTDFRFAWRRESWVPWSWKLVSIHQSEISFDPSWIP